MVPKDVYPLVAAVTLALAAAAHGAHHALFHSPEVHVTRAGRQDELSEAPGLEDKGRCVRSRSFFAALARPGAVPSFFSEASVCPVYDRDD